MKINLTKTQYETLAKTVYLGNWLATSWITHRSDSPVTKEYDGISDYIYSLAPLFGFSNNLEYDLEFTDEGEDDPETRRLIDEYDDETFWQELPDRLGERDFYKKYSAEDRKKMNKEEHFTKLMSCTIPWEKEFEKRGVERLGIIGDTLISSPYVDLDKNNA